LGLGQAAAGRVREWISVTPGQQRLPALTPRQERVVERLRAQIGEGPAEWFTAACELLAQEPQPRAVTHLVAHMYREVEGAVRYVLDPVKEKRGHAASVQAVLDDLGMSAEEEPAVFWLGLASGDRGLAMRAHRSALERPRPAGGEFAELVDSFEGLLDRVLKRFEDRYANVFNRLDELLKVQQPGRGHAGQLRDGFPQNHVTLRYFFERATPEWLVPLGDAGFFSSPPEPVPHDDTGRLEVPPWPQSLYLLRVASDRPREVLETAVAIPATGNLLVNGNLAELALRFPAGEAARLLPRVIASLDARFGVLDPVGVGRLCRHLAAGGRPEDALVLTEALLTRLPGSRGSRAVMDTWSFAEVLRTSVPAVARACGLPAVSLLARVLDETVAAQTPASLRKARRDISGWWRPTIEGQPPGTDTDPASALVSALRDASAEALSAGGADLAAMIAEIESHDWPVFRRLALFLLSEHAGDGDSALVGARLADAGVIQDPGLDREFLLLARRRCTAVGGRDRERLLALIDRGPQVPQWRHLEQNGTPPSAAETRARVSRWQRDRLAAIEPVLPPERLAQYRGLVTEFGAAPGQPAALPAVRDIAVGSPVTAGDLAASSTEDLVKLLATWEPPGGLMGADRPSLASALFSAVRQDAAGRSSAAEAFTGLPGVYAEAVISAFWQAAQEGTALDWPPVLNLCSWTDQQAEAELRASGDRSRRQWEAARMASLRLLEAGFAASGHEIPAELGGQAWAIIENAAADPDPESETEVEADASERPLGEVTMAHVRPKALTTAFAYAAWARRGNQEAGLGSVQQLIENQIDPGQPEPSQAVRWVCGASFSVLAGLFRPWAKEKASVIFPLGEAERRLWTAAWDGYLGRQPDLDMCDVLDGSYQMAVDSLDPAADDRAELARATSLGLHLIIRYWHGRLTFDSHDQLLRRYYRNAPAAARVHLMHFLGRGLPAAAPVHAALLTRLWEERLRAVREGAEPAELAAFGEWFAAGKLGDEWELSQLITALRDAGKIESEHLVLPRLAELAPAHPDACLTALEAWVLTNPTPYSFQRQEDSIRAILRAGTDNGTHGSAEKVTAIIGLCGLRGHDLRKFRDS
jgi:hypothetical protein